MIGRLRGRLVEVDVAGTGIGLVDVGGVGYEVVLDKQTAAALVPGDDVSLWIRTIVREDAFTLFGFDRPEARLVFDLLLTVAQIGPKGACGILGGLPLPDLVQAVRSKDVKRLSQLPGVGKKTAERLALELNDKFFALPVEAPAAIPGIPPTLAQDLRSALMNLGFTLRDVEAAMRDLKPSANAALEDLVRDALGRLSSRA